MLNYIGSAFQAFEAQYMLESGTPESTTHDTNNHKKLKTHTNFWNEILFKRIENGMGFLSKRLFQLKKLI